MQFSHQPVTCNKTARHVFYKQTLIQLVIYNPYVDYNKKLNRNKCSDFIGSNKFIRRLTSHLHVNSASKYANKTHRYIMHIDQCFNPEYLPIGSSLPSLCPTEGQINSQVKWTKTRPSNLMILVPNGIRKIKLHWEFH